MTYKNRTPTPEEVATGQRLDAMRKRAGLSKVALASALGVPPSKITRLINAEETLDSYSLRKALLAVLDGTMAELDGLVPITVKTWKRKLRGKSLKSFIAALIVATLACTMTTGCAKKKLALVPVAQITFSSGSVRR